MQWQIEELTRQARRMNSLNMYHGGNSYTGILNWMRGCPKVSDLRVASAHASDECRREVGDADKVRRARFTSTWPLLRSLQCAIICSAVAGDDKDCPSKGEEGAKEGATGKTHPLLKSRQGHFSGFGLRWHVAGDDKDCPCKGEERTKEGAKGKTRQGHHFRLVVVAVVDPTVESRMWSLWCQSTRTSLTPKALRYQSTPRPD